MESAASGWKAYLYVRGAEPLSAEEETTRRFDSSKCRRMLERVHASGWANVCGFSRAGLNLGQHTFRAQPQQGRDVYYVRNEIRRWRAPSSSES